MEDQNKYDWSARELDYLREEYAITSIVELAKALERNPLEVQTMIEQLGLRKEFTQTDDSDLNIKLMIVRLMSEHKRYLPNGWLVGLDMGHLMQRSLVEQIKRGETWIEEVEEEIISVLEGMVQLYELSPLLNVGDMLKGEDHGQAYRITGREFVPSHKWITYYFTYLYGGDDIPEAFDDYDDDDDDGEDDRMGIVLHNN